MEHGLPEAEDNDDDDDDDDFRREQELPRNHQLQIQANTQPRRVDNCIHLLFPVPGTLQCTEAQCTWSCANNAWTHAKQSLSRHMLGTHLIRVESWRFICVACAAILGSRPSQHICLRNRVVAAERACHPHQCNQAGCPRSFPTRRGLQNHLAKHKREEAERIARQELIPPSPQPAVEQEATQDHIGTQLSQHLTGDQRLAHDALGDAPRSPPPSPHHAFEQEATQDHVGTPLSQHPVRGQRSTHDSFEEALGPLSALADARSPPSPPSIAEQTTQASLACLEELHTHPTLSPRQQDTNVNPASSALATTQPSQAETSLSRSTLDLTENSNLTQSPDDPELPTSQPEELPHENTRDAPEEWFLDQFIAPLNELSRTPNWTHFEQLLEEITSTIQTHCNLRPPSGDRLSRAIDPEDCKTIQQLYRRNRRRAVRLIIEGEPQRCNIRKQTISDHFTEVFAPKIVDIREVDTMPAAPEDRSPVSSEPFSEQEIARRLAKAENTSPGDDGITYRHWKTVDPDAKLLHLIFKICIKEKRIPRQWKRSKTILIPKKNITDADANDIRNWRPIALCRTIYKIYTSYLAERIRRWAAVEDVISPCQKGFMPHDGVIEHNFVMQKTLDKARRHQGNACIALLDLSNAFGSIAPDLIVATMRRSGTGEEMLDIIQDLIRDTTTTIATESGNTDALEVRCGVRQGCPLSGLLFNFGIEPLIRHIVNEGSAMNPETRHHCMAYADDITLLATSPDTLQNLLNTAVGKARAMGLEINTQKCTSLHLSGEQPRGSRPTRFLINNTPIKALSDHESTQLLGRPIGFQVIKDNHRVHHATDIAKTLLRSKLAPWQRLDALRSFVLPSLTFPMRTWQYNKTAYEKFDTDLRPLIKKTLYLPPRASNEYIYGSASSGACGIPIAAEDCDIFLVDTAFKLLTSPDPNTRAVAEEDCSQIAAKRMDQPPTLDIIAPFMSDAELPRRASDIQTLWSRTRSASQRLQVEWLARGPNLILKNAGKELTHKDRRTVAKNLRTEKRRQRDMTLQMKPDQGKVMRLVAADKASSAFVSNGKYISFADWRFIHRARLNLLPLNGAQHGRNNNKSCRRCHPYDETLPHVINHCMRHSATMLRRHNAIVERLKTTALFYNWRTVAENQIVQGTNQRGRPDLVLEKGDEAIIIDVTCPFENGEGAFDKARDEKKAKYAELARELRGTYRNASVLPFIVGSLGAYDPGNATLTRKIASRTYTKTLKLLVSADTIAWSRRIYIEHITGTRQY